jgi:sugar/nucleoside kinase (ribokinase family)
VSAASRPQGPGPRAPGFDVLGVGANSIDFVYTLPAYPEPEGPRSKLRITGTERSPGGQTATVLCACAALGLRTRYVGTISTDENGRVVRDAMQSRGVDVSGAIPRDAPNAFALILLSASDAAARGERIVLWDRDPRMTLTARDLPPDAVSGARLVHVDDVDGEAAVAAGRAAIAAGLPVTSDLEAVKPHTRELLDAVTIPIFAEHVAAELTGEPDLETALRQLRRPHMTLVCATLGTNGAAMLAGDRFVRQPAFRIDAVDTTGAGDVFRAGFIYAFLRGDAPEAILRFACAAAAVSCTRRGAIHSVPQLDDVVALLTQS